MLNTKELDDVLRIAEKAIAEGNWKKAVNVLGSAIDAYKDDMATMKHMAMALLLRGRCHIERSDQALARKDLVRALELARRARAIAIEGEVLVTLATNSWRVGEYDEAKGYLDDAKGIAERTGDDRLMGLIHCARGTVYTQSHKLDAAEREFREAVLLLEKAGHPRELAIAYNNFGNNFIFKDEFEKGVVIYEKCKKVAERVRDGPLTALAKMNRAHCLIEIGRAKEALEELDGVLQRAQRANDVYGTLSANETYGMAYARLGDWERAEEHFFITRRLAKASGSPYVETKVLYQIGRMYMMKGERDKALRFLNEALDIAKRCNMVQGIAKIEKELRTLSSGD